MITFNFYQNYIADSEPKFRREDPSGKPYNGSFRKCSYRNQCEQFSFWKIFRFVDDESWTHIRGENFCLSPRTITSGAPSFVSIYIKI